jgi:hypothetical protein
MTRSLIKEKLKNNFIIFLIYNLLNEFLDYIKFNIIYKCRYKYIYLHKQHLLKKLKKIKKIKNSTICHIIGAGNSLNLSINKISKKDFVFGCNLAALTNLNFDLYTIEFASYPRIGEPNLITHFLVKKKLLNKKSFIIYKNLSSKKINRIFLKEKYQKYINLIADYSWRCFNNKQLEYYLKNKILGSKNKFYQYETSLILLISIAYQLNFNKIVLHGFDMEGKYFYSNRINSFTKKNNYRQELRRHEKNNISNRGVYKDFANVDIINIFNKMSDILSKNRIKLLSASKFSKSSKFLKVFSK